jgi:tetratricopeptide (TPR) repeat protein
MCRDTLRVPLSKSLIPLATIVLPVKDWSVMAELNKRRRFLRTAVLWFLFAGPACFAQTAGQPSDNADIITALRNRNFDQALRLSEGALEKSPHDYRIWTLRGMTYSGEGRSSQALDSFDHALKLNSAYLPALEGAAQVEYQQGKTEAKAYLQRVLALRPGDPTSHAMLGVIAYREKDCANSVVHFQEAGALLSDQPVALAAYGACLAMLGQFEDATALLKKAIAAQPRSKEVRYNLALAEWKAGHAEDALATLQLTDGNGFEDEEFLVLAADICEAQNDTARAIALLRKAILAQPKKVDAYLDLAYISYDHASPQVGVDVLDAGLTQLPENAQIYLVRGVLYAQLSKFMEATEDFATANRLDPNLSFTATALGIVQSQEHRADQALDTFRAAAKAHPKDALTQYLLAEALSQQNGAASHETQAIAAAQLAARLDPQMVAARDLLATLYLRDGHIHAAIEQCRAALTTDPKDQQALYHLILALRETDQKDQVPELLKQLMQLRTAAQQQAAQEKRYRLDDVVTSSTN